MANNVVYYIMQSIVFKSEVSKDEIDIRLLRRSHKAIFKCIFIDVAIEYIGLIGMICDFLKKEDVKWVEVRVEFDPVIPSNTISYINKYNKGFVCHIEDFQAFYFRNIGKFVDIGRIYVDISGMLEDGWTKIIDPKKERMEKYTIVKRQLIDLVGNWND